MNYQKKIGLLKDFFFLQVLLNGSFDQNEKISKTLLVILFGNVD